MIKPLASLLTVWGTIAFLISLFVFFNSPANIDYNNNLKFSMVDSGLALGLLLSTIAMVAGIVLLKVSRVPRSV
jgi:uncharacterized membrane protein YjfL (UPF0719 family)